MNLSIYTVRCLAVVALLALVALAGCGGANAPYSPIVDRPGTNVPGLSFAFNPATQTLNTGTPVNYVVTITPLNGFTGTVNLATAGLPETVTSAFAPAQLTFAAGQSAAQNTTLTLSLPGSIGTSQPTIPFEVIATPVGSAISFRGSASVTLNSLGGVGGVIE